MLRIIKKKYEIEEDIQLLGEDEKELFSFKMQLYRCILDPYMMIRY